MRLSLLFGQQVDDLDLLQAHAHLCGHGGFHRLWLGQSFKIETFAALAALAGRGTRIRCGTAVSLTTLRTPYDAAVQARSVAHLMGEPFSVGFGIGSPAFASALQGESQQRPGTHTAAYVGRVRDLLALKDGIAGDEPLRLYPFPAPQIEVGCGVLRAAMAQKAGGVADFMATWLAPLGHISETLSARAAVGAAAADRPPPRVVSVVPLALKRGERDPRKLAFYSCGMHIRAPHYAAALRQAGLQLTDDIARDLEAIVDSQLFVYGSVESVCNEFEAYFNAGVDEVVVNLTGVALRHGQEAALTDARTIAEAWFDRERLRQDPAMNGPKPPRNDLPTSKPPWFDAAQRMSVNDR